MKIISKGKHGTITLTFVVVEFVHTCKDNQQFVEIRMFGLNRY